MQTFNPTTAEELAKTLAHANRDSRRLGRDFTISLAGLNRILQYNADDLTMNVEAGVTLGEIDTALAAHKQWLPIGAPRPERVTVSQALMQNYSGPFRLFYGSLRDMVIGVRFATVEGKLVKSGGNVVKNVAGYDLGKLLIGSRDTLALLAQVNFRLYPRPACSETIAFGFNSLTASLNARTAIQRSQLTPLAMDLLDAPAAQIVAPQELPPGKWRLIVAYGGVERVIERYRRDVSNIARDAGAKASATLTGSDEQRLWNTITDLPAHMEETSPEVTRIRAASPISKVGACIEAVASDLVVSRAGTGITYFYCSSPDIAAIRGTLAGIAESVVVEHSPAPVDRWGSFGDSLELMTRIKQTLDPNRVLGEW